MRQPKFLLQDQDATKSPVASRRSLQAALRNSREGPTRFGYAIYRQPSRKLRKFDDNIGICDLPAVICKSKGSFPCFGRNVTQ